MTTERSSATTRSSSSSCSTRPPRRSSPTAAAPDSDDADAPLSGEVTHEFVFADGVPTISIRELGEIGGDDDPAKWLGATADDDKTGLQLWAASLVLSRWLVEMRARLAGRTVVELGAGCGLCGVVASVACGAASVVLSDLAAHGMDNLRHNLHQRPRAARRVGGRRRLARRRDVARRRRRRDRRRPRVRAERGARPAARRQRALGPGGCSSGVPGGQPPGREAFIAGLVEDGFECQASAVPPRIWPTRWPRRRRTAAVRRARPRRTRSTASRGQMGARRRRRRRRPAPAAAGSDAGCRRRCGGGRRGRPRGGAAAAVGRRGGRAEQVAQKKLVKSAEIAKKRKAQGKPASRPRRRRRRRRRRQRRRRRPWRRPRPEARRRATRTGGRRAAALRARARPP